MQRSYCYLTLFLLTHPAVFAAEPTPPERYELLFSEGLKGSAFVIEHDRRLWGVCTLLQTEGKPVTRIQAGLDVAVNLVVDDAVSDGHVQMVPVAAGQRVSHLAYDGDFAMAAGDGLVLLTALGPISGKLAPNQKPVRSDAGPQRAVMETTAPLPAPGCSGSPVIFKNTGEVVGVMISAADAGDTRTIEFHTLCIAAAKPLAGPGPGRLVPPDKYQTLIGRDLSGSGFVVRLGDKLWAVASLHQFGGSTPDRFEQLEGDAVPLNPLRVVKQRDVQAIPVAKVADRLPCLKYEPRFSLSHGDDVLLVTGDGVIPAKLSGRNLERDRYESNNGPLLIEATPDKPFPAAGASGCPVVLRKSNAVIGVMTLADDRKNAKKFFFESLCLDPTLPGTLDFSVVLRPFLGDLPKGNGWEYEPADRTNGFELLYIAHDDSKELAKATRRISGFGGAGGPDLTEAGGIVVLEFNDASVAKSIPDKMVAGYAAVAVFLLRDGVVMKDVKAGKLPGIEADAARILRSKGKYTKGDKPFADLRLWACRGRHVFELSLRNLDVTDEQLAKIAAAALDAIEKAETAP